MVLSTLQNTKVKKIKMIINYQQIILRIIKEF